MSARSQRAPALGSGPARAAALLLLLAAAPAAQSQSITSFDGTSVLNFRQDPTLGIVLESLGDDLDPFAMPLGAMGLWHLEFHKGPACFLVGPENLTEFDLKFEVEDHKVTVEWDDAKSPLLPGEKFTVEIEIEAGASNEFEAKIHVTTHTPTSALHRVRFPRFEVVVDGSAPSTRLAAPFGHGVLLVDPAHNPAVVGPAKLNAVLPPCDAVTLAEPGLISMQWWSFYDSSDPEQPQLYYGTRDDKGYRKEWLYELVPGPPGSNRFRPVLRHVPQNNHLNDGDYAQPYPFVMRVVRGDWYDAARYYRKYALTQPWTAQGTMAENPDFSEIMRDADLLGVTQPQFSAAADDPATFCPVDPIYDHYLVWPAETQSQEIATGVQDIVPRIFFWDFNAFGGDLGNWFPTRAQFATGGQMLAGMGDDFGVYFLGTAYSTRIPSYLDSYVVDSVNGGTYGPVEPYGLVNAAGVRRFSSNPVCSAAPVTFPSVVLCLATQFAADYAAHVAAQVHADSGANGMYQDLLTGSDVELCYDPTHGHPLGGGSYYTEGIQNIMETVRQRLRFGSDSPEFFQQSEGASERFLPWLEAVHPQLTWTRTQTFCDLFTGQCPRNGTHFLVVPTYGVVYHDYQLTSATFQLAAPSTFLSGGVSILANPFTMRSVRNMWASHVRLGFTPFGGTLLSDELTNDNATSGLYPDYSRLIGFVKNVMAVLQVEDVRDFTTFGARLRDPRLTRANPAESPLTAVPFDIAPIAHNWLGYGRLQPLVYGTIFGRGRNGGDPSDDVDEEIGLLLINWSDPSDNAFLLTPDAGPQTVRVALDPDDYRPGAETYAAYLVGPSGETLFSSGPITGDELKLDVLVPARSAVFLRIELETAAQ